MRIFFSVGEPSGDLHGANLISDLRSRNPNLEAVGFGGPRMAEAGCQLLYPLASLAVMGLWNVLRHIRHFFALLRDADRYFAEHPVDAVVLIDYPGFNWCLARRAKRRGIPVIYYGVPQMWAWAPWRVRKLQRLVDHVLCKLPFEAPWFANRNVEARYVGHPYFDEVHRYQADPQFLREYDDPRSRLLVLLPGSRTQEVQRNLPTLVESARRVVRQHPDVAVAIACYSEKHADTVRHYCDSRQLPIDVMAGRTPELIQLADVCIACSGSVSLELLHYRKPSVIVYRVSSLVRLLSYVLLRSRFITLVNLLAVDDIGRRGNPAYDPDSRAGLQPPMPEYLRSEDCSVGVARWINDWLGHPNLYAERVAMLESIADRFAEPGASDRAADQILAILQGENETLRQATSDDAADPTSVFEIAQATSDQRRAA